MSRVGGRPRRIETDDIIRIGRELGLNDLSLNAVAGRLGVSSTALYRHVDGRWALERLVGESILSDVNLVDDPAHDTAQHLISFGLQLRTAILDNPGLAGYVQTLFPRGESGRRLLAAEVHALVGRGYTADGALVLATAVATIAIGYAAGEDAQRQQTDGRAAQELTALTELRADAALGDAYGSLPDIGQDEYVRLWLGAAVRAFIEAAPPGRSAHDIRAALTAVETGR